MNIYTAWCILNITICLVVLGIAYITDSPWSLLGFFFLTSISSRE